MYSVIVFKSKVLYKCQFYFLHRLKLITAVRAVTAADKEEISFHFTKNNKLCNNSQNRNL